MTTPVSNTTLTQTRSVVLDASGSGVIYLRPDVGQNWAPLFVRVSTASRTSPVAYCALYHGSPGVPVQQSQFIDDTFLGSGDTSSMIAGTPVLFGEALIFNFLNGTPGDTAIATVFGMTSTLPPNLDLLPQVPGTHFQGHLSTETITTIAQSQGSNIIVGGGNQIGTVIDVRQFASYYLSIDAITSTNPATNYNHIEVDLFWTADLAATIRIYADTLVFFADANSISFGVSLGTVFAQDTMHGGFMRVNFTNNGLDNVSVQWRLLGTTRQLPGPFVRQGNFPDGVLVSEQDTIPAGGTLLIPMPLAYGEAEWWLNNMGAAAMTPFLDYNLNGNDQIAPPVPANTVQPFTVVMPKRAGILTIKGTVGQTVTNRVITQYQKQ